MYPVKPHCGVGAANPPPPHIPWIGASSGRIFLFFLFLGCEIYIGPFRNSRMKRIKKGNVRRDADCPGCATTHGCLTQMSKRGKRINETNPNCVGLRQASATCSTSHGQLLDFCLLKKIFFSIAPFIWNFGRLFRREITKNLHWSHVLDYISRNKIYCRPAVVL